MTKFTVMLAIGGMVLTPCLNGQMAQLTGTVKDGNGTPLNAALITVKDGQGRMLHKAVTNTDGIYQTTAPWGSSSVEGRVIVDPDAITYSKNPLEQPLTISARTATKDFTFYQVTTSAFYWTTVGKRIQITSDKITGLEPNSEWMGIFAADLPPDSKAAAAHQWKPMRWSAKITDPTFQEYGAVDQNILSRALKGDEKALVKLPKTVMMDVKALK